MKKRNFLLLVLVMLLTVGVGTLISEHQGYVLISWKNIRFESTLWIFILCLFLVALALYILRTLVRIVFRSAGWVNPWSGSNKQKRLQTSIDKGLLSYASGNWNEAVKHLSYAAKSSPQPLPYMLDAARAAEKLQQTHTTDELVQRALGLASIKQPAVALCLADIYQSRGNPEQAQSVLLEAYEHNSNNHELIARLLQLAKAQQDWSLQLKLLPSLRKTKLFDQQQLLQIETQAWQGRLNEHSESLSQVKAIWDTLPSQLRKQPSLLLAYCSQHIRFQQPERAEEMLRTQLNQEVDVQLLQAYAQLPHKRPELAVQNAERWLEQVPSNALALYALGKLCLQAELWGKARDYFQASLLQDPQPKVYAELARLLNQMGDYKRSIQLLTASINMQERRTESMS